MALWDKIASRGRVEDRRAFGPTGAGLGLGGIAIVVALTFLSGGSVTDVLPTVLNELQSAQTAQNPGDTLQFEGADSYEVFVSTVLGSTNDVWSQAFDAAGRTYTPPNLVLFREATESACGGATSSVGPHYCPLDETIYLDETFFDELTARFGAQGGDVAQAYVIAHEVGHHVQHALGTADAAQRDGSNEASVKLELQADCFAGIWAHSLRNKEVFAPGEISEAMDAAAAVGDDRIQQKTQGRINPESWTHGSSEQRVDWFTHGYQTGSVEACNAFL